MEIKKYYSEEFRREMLELSDRHIDWDFGAALPNSKIDAAQAEHRYTMAKTMYTEDFENHYHVKVWFCGRSGRHVCVEDTAENRRKYAVMSNAVELMQKLIVGVAVDNYYTLFGFMCLPQWISRVNRENKREINERYPKTKVFLMFYPISWERHIFDYTDMQDIPDKVKELKANSLLMDAKDITFVPWGETEENTYDDSLDWDVECLNNWDDDTTEEERFSNLKRIKGTTLSEWFIRHHWCIAVTEETKAVIENN